MHMYVGMYIHMYVGTYVYVCMYNIHVFVYMYLCTYDFHFIATPGLLLIINPSRIEYVQLTESSLQIPSTILEDRRTLLDPIDGTVSGMHASLCKWKYLLPARFQQYVYFSQVHK